jgi:hypothetical protein
MIDSVAGALVNPIPRPDQHHLADDRQIGRARGSGGGPSEARGQRDEAGGHDQLRAAAHGEGGAEDGRDAGHDCHRQQPHAGAERLVALQELEVKGDQEDEPHQREEADRHRTAGGAESKVPKQPDVEHRSGCTPLPGDEDNEQRGSEREADEAAGLAPALVRGLDDRVDQNRHRRR